MTTQGPRKPVDDGHAAARLVQAREFHESARSLVTLAQNKSYNGAITLMVTAAIAYADTITAAFKGVVNKRDHQNAPRLLREVLTALIPPDATLGDAAHPVCISAVNVTDGKPQVFKTRHVADWRRHWKRKAVDVALATEAAPTFFERAEVGNSRCADGRLFANAPDLVAVHEAEHFFDVPRGAIRLLRIGTTTQKYSVSHSDGGASASPTGWPTNAYSTSSSPRSSSSLSNG